MSETFRYCYNQNNGTCVSRMWTAIRVSCRNPPKQLNPRIGRVSTSTTPVRHLGWSVNQYITGSVKGVINPHRRPVTDTRKGVINSSYLDNPMGYTKRVRRSSFTGPSYRCLRKLLIGRNAVGTNGMVDLYRWRTAGFTANRV